MTHALGLALVAAGCAVAVTAAFGAVAVSGDVFARLHFLTPVTSIAAPLVGAGLSVESGQPWVIAEVVLICLLVFASGPVLDSATARVAASRRELIDSEQPQ